MIRVEEREGKGQERPGGGEKGTVLRTRAKQEEEELQGG